MNVLIIGFGKVGKIRFDIINKKNFVRNIYVYDPFYKKNKTKINILSNLNHIKNLKIDAAFVCVPNFLAAKYTAFLIKKNINVFCEKPPSNNINSLKKIKKIFKYKKNLNLMYGFNHRHHESIKKILSFIKSKKFGNILWIRSRYGKPIDNNYIQGWRGNLKKSGGGILIDQGIHLLDLIILFLGKVKNIKSLLSNSFVKRKIEDNAFVILENFFKQTASIHSTLTQWRHLFSIEIFFEKGYVVLNGLRTPSGNYGDEVLAYCKNTIKPPGIKWSKTIYKRYKTDRSFLDETEFFLKKIQDKKKISVCSIDDAIYLMDIINIIYKQNKNIFI